MNAHAQTLTRAPRATPYWSWPVRVHAAIKLMIQRRLWGLAVGPGTRVHPTALLDRTWPTGLRIGADCLLDAHSVVLTHDFTRGLLTDTVVGDGCRIGARALVMPGLTIGAGSVVMPGAVVTRDMPPGSVAIGNPARVEPLNARDAADDAPDGGAEGRTA